MSRRLSFAWAALATIGTSHAGTLRKIWDFDAGAPVVYDLRFSPDGQRIAAVVGRSWQDEFVLVLGARDAQDNKRRIEIDPSELVPYASRYLSWSPSGQQLFIGDTGLHLADGKTCSLQDMAGLRFIGENQLIEQKIRSIPSHTPGGTPFNIGQHFLSFVDSGCRSGGVWDLPDEDALFDASADRGLICVRQSRRTLVIDAFSRTVLRDVPGLGRQVGTLLLPVLFADSGKAICGVAGPDWGVTASCFDVDTGKELATTRTFTVLEIGAAHHARRVVLSDYGRIFDFIDFHWVAGSLKKRIVWDFGTNKELVSWSPNPRS